LISTTLPSAVVLPSRVPMTRSCFSLRRMYASQICSSTTGWIFTVLALTLPIGSSVASMASRLLLLRVRQTRLLGEREREE